MDIRRATDADWPALWAIMEPIIREGETLCLPRDGDETFETAGSIPMHAGVTHVKQWLPVLRTTGLRCKRGLIAEPGFNRRGVTENPLRLDAEMNGNLGSVELRQQLYPGE